jgi:hypothetical protein
MYLVPFHLIFPDLQPDGKLFLVKDHSGMHFGEESSYSSLYIC